MSENAVSSDRLVVERGGEFVRDTVTNTLYRRQWPSCVALRKRVADLTGTAPEDGETDQLVLAWVCDWIEKRQADAWRAT